MNPKTKKLIYAAVLSAIGMVLVTAIPHIPIFPSADWLRYDTADIPVFFGAVLLGPYWGLAITLAVSVYQGLVLASSNGFLGILMHFLATGSFAFVAGYITRQNKLRRLSSAYILGGITMILIMIPINMIISAVFINMDLTKLWLYTKNVLSGIISFAGGVKTVLSIAGGIAAFSLGVFFTILYDVKRKGKTAISRLVFAVITGIVYAACVIYVLNFAFGSVELSGMQSAIAPFIWTVYVPFNAIKAYGNAIIAAVSYVAVGRRFEVKTAK